MERYGTRPAGGAAKRRSFAPYGSGSSQSRSMTGAAAAFAEVLGKDQSIEWASNHRIPDLDLLGVEDGDDLFGGLGLELALLDGMLPILFGGLLETIVCLTTFSGKIGGRS